MRRALAVLCAMALCGDATAGPGEPVGRRRSPPNDPAFVRALRSAEGAVSFIGAPSGDPRTPVAHLANRPMVAIGPALTPAMLRELEALVVDDRHGFHPKICMFEPTVGYLVDGEPPLEIVICHGCADLKWKVGELRGFMDIGHSQLPLLDLARRLFPDEPRLLRYRHQEFWPYMVDVVVRDAEQAERFAGGGAGADGPAGVERICGYAMAQRGPPVSGERLEDLRRLLRDPASVSYEPTRGCNPDVGYRFRSDRGRVDVALCHACEVLAVVYQEDGCCPSYLGTPRHADVAGIIRYASIRSSAEAFLRIASPGVE